ncbi:hypothetical protein LOAG_01751 [Loa loa]|uniref:Uncharacterized protein n=1 Tax=Loa loa TaxID=7209 RepID=A0A1S0U8R5_LOALO|nr:hypothetical protein LOAG_01751 [Loa loa]EFO26735.1 hypothetical protein LOAG_01751 [Loa loa]
MILSGTPVATVRCTPPISVSSSTNDASASSAMFSELLLSSNIHIPDRPVVTIRSLSAATRTPAVAIPGTEESDFTSTRILNGNVPSAFRPIIPTTSSDSFVVTTLNSLISPSDHESANSERNHQHHHYHQQHHHLHHQHHQKQQQNDRTVNGDYGQFCFCLFNQVVDMT